MISFALSLVGSLIVAAGVVVSLPILTWLGWLMMLPLSLTLLAGLTSIV